MNVLSLFDGMSCGQIALNKLGINYDKYFACEIDKYAMQVTQHNFPDTIQLGDVQFVTKETFGTNKIDLLMGGSPCQGFSFAGKQLNFEDPRSVLFFEFVRLLKELKPKYFLLENVKMKRASQDIISKYLGCEPIEINSSLVSAQTRKRLYWTNIPNVTQPEDKGIILKDVIEPFVDEKEDKELRPATIVGRRLNERGVREDYNKDVPMTQCLQVKHNSDKSGTLTTVEKDNVLSENEPGRYPNAYENKKLSWRKLTPLECERLQTVPDKVFLVNFEICIDQAKNFVSAVNKNPKLQKLVSNAEREELLEYVKLARENTRRRNPKIKPIAHQNVGTLTQMQIRECIKTSLKGLNTNAKDAESCATSKNPIIEVGSVDWNVSTIITDGKTIGLGKGASPLKDNLSVRVKSGKNALSISGIEMTQLAEDVEKGLNTKTVSNSTSIMLSLFSTKSIEQMLIIYYLFAENVIDGYIPKETRKENTYLPLIIFEGYTSVVSNSQRYKMLGNGWTVDVITHILKNMEL